MAKRLLVLVISLLLVAAGFSVLTGGRPSGPVLEIDESALSILKTRGNDFYVKPGRAG